MGTLPLRRVAPLAFGVALAGAALAGPAAASSGGHDDDAASYTVTVENLTEGQWLTPPNFAAHRSGVRVFGLGRPASPGVVAVAENGMVPVLAAELGSAIDGQGLGTSGVGPGVNGGPIPPGATVSFEVTSPERRFSLVSMVICTNDGFAGVDSVNLPRWAGDAKTLRVQAYDAGSEINTERHDDLVPAPFCGGGGKGSTASNPALAEGGKVRVHRGVSGVGDLGPQFDWANPVAEVTITRH